MEEPAIASALFLLARFFNLCFSLRHKFCYKNRNVIQEWGRALSNEEKLFDVRDWVPYQLWRLSQEAGYILEDQYSEKYNIKGESWRFMAMLASSAPVSAKELGGLLDMDQVQVTRALNKLLDYGFVSRRMDPRDRRKVILNLSRKGAEVYQAIVVMAKALEQKLLAQMPPQDQAKFRGTLSRLLTTVEQMRLENEPKKRPLF